MSFKRRIKYLSPCLLILLAACSSDDKKTALVHASQLGGDVTRVTADANAVSTAHELEVTLDANDVSMLVQLKLSDATAGLMFTEVRDPDGVAIYTASLDQTTGEPGPVISDYFNAPIGGDGAVSVFFPPTPELTLKTGTYHFKFATEDNVALTHAEVFVKTDPAPGDIELVPLETELNVWIVHPDAAFNGAAFEQTFQTIFKDSINTILAPHALRINTINLLKAPAGDVAKYASIDAEDDVQIAAACRAMQAKTTRKLALNLIYAQELTSDDDDGPAGFSPSPGTILDDQSASGCFFVGQTAYAAEPDQGFTQHMSDQMMAGNILHEAAHFMSLQHPTEADGLSFDHLLDTPQCDAVTYDGRDDALFGVPGVVDGEVTDFECSIDGGAKNFLFYAGVPQFLPYEMSADQAKVLRRHPLFVRQP